MISKNIKIDDNDTLEAIASVKASNLRKKINAASWSENMEILMKQWGEKSAGLRYMHQQSAGSWKNFSNKLTMSGIIITSIASTLSLIAASVEDSNIKNGFLFGVGGIGLISTFIQSLKKFYNAEEKAADHASIAKQFGSYYRNMVLQLGMSREDRNPSDVLGDWALREIERLQQDAPNISGNVIDDFKKKFSKTKQSYPDIAEDEYIIEIYNSEKEPVENNNYNKDNLKTSDIELSSNKVD